MRWNIHSPRTFSSSFFFFLLSFFLSSRSRARATHTFLNITSCGIIGIEEANEEKVGRKGKMEEKSKKEKENIKKTREKKKRKCFFDAFGLVGRGVGEGRGGGREGKNDYNRVCYTDK